MPVNTLEEAEAFLAECRARLHASRTKSAVGARGRYGRALDKLMSAGNQAFIVLDAVFHKTTFTNTQARFDQVCQDRNLDPSRYRLYQHINDEWLLIDWGFVPQNDDTPDLETQFEAYVMEHSPSDKNTVKRINEIANAAIKLDKAASK